MKLVVFPLFAAACAGTFGVQYLFAARRDAADDAETEQLLDRGSR